MWFKVSYMRYCILWFLNDSKLKTFNLDVKVCNQLFNLDPKSDESVNVFYRERRVEESMRL